MRLVSEYVKRYNTVRLHSAIGYITPADCLCGLTEVIHVERNPVPDHLQRRVDLRD